MKSYKTDRISLILNFLKPPGNFAFIILFLLAACNKPASEKEAETAATETHAGEEHHDEAGNTVEFSARQYEVAGIEIGKAEMKNLSQVLKVSGLLDVPPQNLVSISAPLGGFVKNTELLQGKLVKKGAVIATIENPEFIQLQQDYLENKSRLDFLKLELDRQKELRAENVNSAKTLQQTEAEFKSVQARVSGLQEKLAMIGIGTAHLQPGKITRMAPIVSPITGYVTEVNVNIGKYVNPTDVLFTIANTEHLHVELTIFEKDASKIKTGQKVRFMLPNENQERIATIYLIGREVSPERTIRVHAHLDKEDQQLLPGTYVNALVELKGTSVKALPQEAVVHTDGKNYVFVAQGKRMENKEVMHAFKMLEVMTGVTENGFTEVFLPESLPDSTRLVTKGAYALLAKMKNTEEEGGGHGH